MHNKRGNKREERRGEEKAKKLKVIMIGTFQVR